eukprot:TRINITY_DN103654_c0_g1_i1.p1 TRINITY_DN103654_c0_g1~~TRINITY_DN103654_c0_g1_i1.p1  ORF type:complete len:313 (-),score=4.18 TRINITY_DN103654_c0_g1_i1:41-955(-)
MSAPNDPRLRKVGPERDNTWYPKWIESILNYLPQLASNKTLNRDRWIILSVAMMLVFVLGWTMWHCSPKVAGYCDTDIPPSVGQPTSEDCHACPEHGYCAVGELQDCTNDHVPFNRKCIPSTYLAERRKYTNNTLPCSTNRTLTTEDEMMAAVKGLGGRLGMSGNLTRHWYHQLLPTCVRDDLDVPICVRAAMVIQGRHSARMAARTQTHFPSYLFSLCFDGFRELWRHGRFQAHGLTVDQIWQKARGRTNESLVAECDKAGKPTAQCEAVCEVALDMAFHTNKKVNKLVGYSPPAEEPSGEEL